MSSEAATTNGMTRREELLAVATKLFAARGYHGTRMDDVADAVGLNKATVYHYYASKSLILYDIYKGAADFTVDALHDDPTASARETIYHFTRRLLVGIASNIERAAVYFQEGPYISEWFTEDQVVYIREKETQVYEHVRDVIDRGIKSGEFYDCDSHVLALGYIGMTLGSYRWLRPQGRRTAQEIAEEFSTALLRGLIRDETVRVESPLGIDEKHSAVDLEREPVHHVVVPHRRRVRQPVNQALRRERNRLVARQCGGLLDESGPEVPCLDLAGVADSPLDDSVGEDLREPRAGGRQRVEEEFAIAESVGQAGKQFPDFTLGEIHEKPFGDDHRRTVSGYLVQPDGIGHRRADHAVCVGLVV